MSDELFENSTPVEEKREIMRVHRETNSPLGLSYEKLIGAVITLIVTGVCAWVASSVNILNKEVIELRVTVEFQSKQVQSLVNLVSAKDGKLTELELRLSTFHSIDERLREVEQRLRAVELTKNGGS